jgi:hypothetical protein
MVKFDNKNKKKIDTRQAMYMSRNIVARSVKHCWHERAITITYSKFESVALAIQHVMCMRHIILSSAASPDLKNLSTIYHKRYDFRKSYSTQNACFNFSLKVLPGTFLILRITHQDVIINILESSSKVSVILVMF